MPQTVAPVTDIDARGYARPDVLVSTQWVADHLDDPNVRIAESDEDVLLYETGHIPGAVKVDWVADLNDPLLRDYVGRERCRTCPGPRGINGKPPIVFLATKTKGGPTTVYWCAGHSGLPSHRA